MTVPLMETGKRNLKRLPQIDGSKQQSVCVTVDEICLIVRAGCHSYERSRI